MQQSSTTYKQNQCDSIAASTQVKQILRPISPIKQPSASQSTLSKTQNQQEYYVSENKANLTKQPEYCTGSNYSFVDQQSKYQKLSKELEWRSNILSQNDYFDNHIKENEENCKKMKCKLKEQEKENKNLKECIFQQKLKFQNELNQCQCQLEENSRSKWRYDQLQERFETQESVLQKTQDYMKSVEVKAQFLLQENNQVQDQLKKKNEEIGIIKEKLRKECDTNLGSQRQFMEQDSAYRLQIEKLQNKLNQMKEEMMNQDSVIGMLQQDSQIHQNKHTDFQCKLQISQNQLTSYQQEINQVKNEWQNQEQKIQQLENERLAMEEEIQFQLQENEQLALRLQSVTDLYAETKESFAQIESQLDQKNQAFAEQQYLNQELELQKNELSLSLQDKHRSLESLQEQVQELTSRLNKQDLYVKELLGMIASSESMTTGLSEKFNLMALDVEKAERQEREWEQRAQRAEQKLEEEIKEKEKITKQFEQFNGQLAVEQEKIARLNKDLFQSQKESKDARSKLQTMETNFEIQCAELNRQLMFKETELTRRINENEKLTRINSKSQNNVHSLTKRLESVKDSMRNSSKTKINEVETLKTELRNLSSQYDTLKVQTNGLKQTNLILKERLPKEHKKSISNEVEEKSQATNEEKNPELSQQNRQNQQFQSQQQPKFIVSQRLDPQQQKSYFPKTMNYYSNYPPNFNNQQFQQ